MNIPDKFIMARYCNEWLMELQRDGKYSCTASNGEAKGFEYGSYEKETVADWLNGTYKIKADLTVYNGVDAEDKPLHFTKDMLKPFMRVVTKYHDYIVCEHPKLGAHLVREDGGHQDVKFPNETLERQSQKDFCILKVYAQPDITCMLDTTAKGNLIWCYVDTAEQKRESELKDRLNAVDSQIKSLQEEYNKLKAEAEKLRGEVLGEQ